MKRKIVLFCIMLIIALCAVGALVGCGSDNDEDDDYSPPVFFFYYTDRNEITMGIDDDLTQLDLYRTGYRFGGAFADFDGQGKQYFDSRGRRMAEVSDGMTVYAYWIPQKFPLVLRASDEDFRIISDVTYDSELVVLDVPTAKSGYTFAGWAGRIVKLGESTDVMITDNNGHFLPGKNIVNEANGWYIDSKESFSIVLYAKFDYEQYDITFNYNGLAENDVVNVYYDHTIENLPEFEPAENCEFIGWSYENSNVNYVLYNDEKITGPLTLYAIVLRYVVFDIYDGDNNKIATKRIYDNGETLRLSDLELELPKGYRAGNWYNNSTMSGSSRITAVTYNTVKDALYVDIVPIEYTAELIVGDAVVSGGTRYTYTCEDIVVLPAAEKDNYSFLGWCTDEELTAAPITRLQKGTIGNIKLYPKFKGVDVTLNLYPQNGGSPTAVACEYGQTFTLNVPTKVGYTFLGWFGSETGGTRYTGANGKSAHAIDFTEPLSLYAQWIINEYTVSYVDGDGNVLTSQTYEHGQRLIFPADPTKEALMFSGWYNKEFSEPFSDGIKVTEDISVYALFVDSLEILTADQLKAIAQNPSGNYHLGADINMGGETWTPIGDFKGILDGKGHKIFNFGLALSSEVANFGFVRVNNGTIKNVGFGEFTWNVSLGFNNDVFIAVIAGINNGIIMNCSVDNDVPLRNTISASSGSNEEKRPNLCWGAVSAENHGLISHCSINIDMSVSFDIRSSVGKWANYNSICELWIYIGGITGYNEGKIICCNSTFDYSGSYKCVAEAQYYRTSAATALIYMGGLVGTNRYGKVERCFADTKTSNTISTESIRYTEYCNTIVQPFYGSLVGKNCARIDASYATGTIKGRSTATTYVKAAKYGGLVGLNEQSSEIYNSYCDAAVVGESGAADIGGFVGNNEGKIQNCYSSGSVTADNNGGCGAGAFVGYINTQGSVTGCFALGNITVAANATVGKFVGGNDGSIRKCYFGDNVVAKNGGNSVGDNNRGATEKSESELYSRELLVDELFWDEEVWVIDGIHAPKLAWQD
ncbi:MAG: InlB B-repeat-containing protein [Clostridiales bacterium]|nr:InlB B-repeat-containing protein [Clostridiales bacterium]